MGCGGGVARGRRPSQREVSWRPPSGGPPGPDLVWLEGDPVGTLESWPSFARVVARSSLGWKSFASSWGSVGLVCGGLSRALRPAKFVVCGHGRPWVSPAARPRRRLSLRAVQLEGDRRGGETECVPEGGLDDGSRKVRADPDGSCADGPRQLKDGRQRLSE